MTDIIDLIFFIINLLLIVFLIVYLSRKYLLPSVYESINEENKYFNDLENKLQNISINQIKLDKEIVDQEENNKLLILKINNWKTKVANIKIQKELVKEQLINDFEKKLDLQYHNYKAKRLSEQITPELIKKLKNDLEIFFSDKINSKNYLNSVIEKIEKKSI